MANDFREDTSNIGYYRIAWTSVPSDNRPGQKTKLWGSLDELAQTDNLVMDG
jgi:hypothetical protein